MDLNKTSVAELLIVSKTLLQDAGAYACKTHSKTLDVAVQCLKKVAGGTSNGALWRAGELDDATYDEIENKAKEQLLQQDGPGMIKLCKTVVQDP